jgi:hypothetical protein
MPNHVTNTLEIYVWHDDHDDLITGLRELITGDDPDRPYIDFEAIIPPPDHPAYRKEGLTIEDKQAEPVYNWYSWNVNNWGTKWNAYSQELLEQDNYTLKIQFDTAWSPPEPVIARLRDMLEEKYPRGEGYETYLSGAWIEEGYQSAGVF